MRAHAHAHGPEIGSSRERSRAPDGRGLSGAALHSGLGNRGLLQLLRSARLARSSRGTPAAIARACSCEGAMPCPSCGPTPIQAKLDLGGGVHVSEPGDPSEREADRVGTQIADSILSAQSASGLAVSPHARSGGLPEPLAREVGARLGYDLGEVRIHTDGEAAHMASALSANAFTTGHDIYFAAGRYAPETPAGLRLLTHELTHVVQQSGGGGPVVHRHHGAPAPVAPRKGG